MNQDIFISGDRLLVYGKGNPNDVFSVRLHDPTGKIILIESIPANDDGNFAKEIFVWPEPTRNVALGTYTVEILSSIGETNTQEIPVRFVGSLSDNENGFPTSGILLVKLDSPDLVSINEVFRIYVQVTFDGALVNADPASLLGSSHIHSGNSTINLSDKFNKLHEGLYYADVTLEKEGSYIVHAISFHKGFLSHDSRVISAGISSIGSIGESVDELNARLNATNNALNQLQDRLDQTSMLLNDTRTTITNSLVEARTAIGAELAAAQESVKEIGEASGQINSIILPILALISVILALQISLFARIRASYR